MLARGGTAGRHHRRLDRLAESFIREHGGVPTFLGYRGFPALHLRFAERYGGARHPGGVPHRRGRHAQHRRGRHAGRLRGRLGHHLGRGRRRRRGPPSPGRHRRRRWRRPSRVSCGRRLGDVSHAVQEVVEAAGFSVVRSLVGHGVGREMHEDPQIPNYGEAGRGPRLEEGMVFAIEPMVNAGALRRVCRADDGWTIHTADGSLSAHFEHTVAVGKTGAARADAPPLGEQRDGVAQRVAAMPAPWRICGATAGREAQLQRPARHTRHVLLPKPFVVVCLAAVCRRVGSMAQQRRSHRDRGRGRRGAAQHHVPGASRQQP